MSVDVNINRSFIATNTMPKTKVQSVLELARRQRLLRPRDLDAHNIPRDYLDRLYRRGLLDHLGRGLYAWPDADLGENQTLAEAAKRVPQGIVCLLSALRFHDLTTQSAFEVWLTLPIKARRPHLDYPPLRVVRASEPALSTAVEKHLVEGVPIRVYGVARTVADCFKYRNKIGLDVALEALRDCWRQRRCTMDELWQAARVCRMTNVMRPYLESLT
jgi:predicted transcriptional regulator of viral defense system